MHIPSRPTSFGNSCVRALAFGAGPDGLTAPTLNPENVALRLSLRAIRDQRSSTEDPELAKWQETWANACPAAGVRHTIRAGPGSSGGVKRFSIRELSTCCKILSRVKCKTTCLTPKPIPAHQPTNVHPDLTTHSFKAGAWQSCTVEVGSGPLWEENPLMWASPPRSLEKPDPKTFRKLSDCFSL